MAAPHPSTPVASVLLPVRRPLRIVDNLVRMVHMHHRTVPQAPRRRNIFRLREIVMRRPKQFIRLPEPVMRAEPRSIGNGSFRPLPSSIAARLISLIAASISRIAISSSCLHRTPGPVVAQVMPRRPQIAQRMQVRRVRPRNLLRPASRGYPLQPRVQQLPTSSSSLKSSFVLLGRNLRRSIC